MADSFDFGAEGEKQLVQNLKLLTDRMEKRVKNAVAETTLAVQGEAKRNAPVDIGTLRSSITHQFQDDGFSSIVGPGGAASAYAAAVEFGTVPHPEATDSRAAKQHFPPPDALEKWAKRKGLQGLEFVIARKIFEEGIAPQPYLIPAFDKEVPKFDQRLRKEIPRAIDDVSI